MAYFWFFPGIVSFTNYQDAKKKIFNGKQGRVLRSYSALENEKRRKRQLENEEILTMKGNRKLMENHLQWNTIKNPPSKGY